MQVVGNILERVYLENFIGISDYFRLISIEFALSTQMSVGPVRFVLPPRALLSTA